MGPDTFVRLSSFPFARAKTATQNPAYYLSEMHDSKTNTKNIRQKLRISVRALCPDIPFHSGDKNNKCIGKALQPNTKKSNVSPTFGLHRFYVFLHLFCCVPFGHFKIATPLVFCASCPMVIARERGEMDDQVCSRAGRWIGICNALGHPCMHA